MESELLQITPTGLLRFLNFFCIDPPVIFFQIMLVIEFQSEHPPLLPLRAAQIEDQDIPIPLDETYLVIAGAKLLRAEHVNPMEKQDIEFIEKVLMSLSCD